MSSDLQFHSTNIHTWLEKGSIRPDVNQTAAAGTMNKIVFAQKAPRRTSGRECKKLIHINKYTFSVNHKSSP